MIYLPFSLSKAQQIIDASLKRIEDSPNVEEKIAEIDRTWHQLYGMKSILESCEIDLLQETRKSLDFQRYKEFTLIYELVYHQMVQIEDMFEKTTTQQE